jgi:hypothetical protein
MTEIFDRKIVGSSPESGEFIPPNRQSGIEEKVSNGKTTSGTKVRASATALNPEKRCGNVK